MSLGLTLSFTFNGDEISTFEELRDFVKLAESHGASDMDELHVERDRFDEVEGFSMYIAPKPLGSKEQ